MQQSTLKKLSEVLGISISTVSRALKDHPDISAATKKKVKELATALEYEPNNSAVQLRTRQSNILGILVPTINNFFYDSFISAVEEDARLHGYSVMIMQSRDSYEIEAANLHLFRKNMAMGVFAAISTETENMSAFDKLEDLKIPVVFVDRVPQTGAYFKVCMADEFSAKLIAETIVEKKKKNVLALFGHPHLSLSAMRLDAFTKVFREQSPGTNLIIEHPEVIEESEKVALRYLQGNNRPDVVFCMGDMILMGVMYAIHQLKLKVPDDISVISISNGFIPTLYNPKITHVETSGYKLGKLAFEQMFRRLKNEPVKERLIVESHLIPGGSI
ncbi:MAG: LacI family DNA-binding transcriptional regulator [Bacteroidota bacterium]